MSPDERSETAHRTVTRMVDAALRNPSDIDLGTMIADHINNHTNPMQAMADITEAAIWQTAAALLTPEPINKENQHV